MSDRSERVAERSEGSLAEKLGFNADARVAVLHADDIGMCRAANAGSFAALGGGSMTCGSVMVPCPAFADAAEFAAATPGLDIGVHLTLNAEWETWRWGPVAGAAAVPSLVDDDGFLFRTQGDVLRNASAEDVERELRAQVDAAIAAGLDPTHLDSHMGTLLFPPFVDIYERLLRDYRLPGALMSAAALHLTGNEALREMAERLDEAVGRLRLDGFPILDAMDANSLHFGPGEGAAHNEGRIAELGAGVTYLVAHPAQGGEELSAIAPDAHCRDSEREFYSGPEGAEALARHGIETVGMSAVRALLRN